MIKTLVIVGTLYLAALVLLSYRNRLGKSTSKDFFLAGANLGSVLGLFTFAATLFSTFTILGMPDFFRVHGVGAWIFIAVSDLVMVFIVLWLGYHLRTKVGDYEFMGMAGFIAHLYKARWVGYIMFATAFVFLIPYVAIQIRGVATFLDQAFPAAVPLWVWAVGMVVVMIIYSEVGGLKAIIYNDVLQGIMLLVVIWIIGIVCLNRMDGLTGMFNQIEEHNPALLSVPGPKGLFGFQFLFGSMIAICMIPFTQPQVSCRLIIMKNHRSLGRTAMGLGVFAILVILPTMFIGMYGAYHYGDATPPEFLGNTLLKDQSGPIAALVLIGLIAAAISTADSQIFALGGETRSLLHGEDQRMMRTARICIAVFAVLSLVFALMSSDELVLLARASFAGTALLAPMIFFAIFDQAPDRFPILPIATGIAVVILVGANVGLYPSMVAGWRLDLVLLGLLTLVGLVGKVLIKPAS